MRFFKNACLIATGALALGCSAPDKKATAPAQAPTQAKKLVPPAKGQIEVAFLMSDGAVMIDFAGPWEVFSDVHTFGNPSQQHPFHLYTVAETKAVIHASGGMPITPDYTFDNAPQPTIVVVPQQNNNSPRALEWIRKMSKQSDVVMSVCTGAFLLAQAGVLDGKKATTHHVAIDTLQRQFPAISVQKGKRYVEADPVIFTSGGLSSGIDLALHVVELYFGREVAEETARQMEYEGKGWTGDGSATMSFEAPVKRGLTATMDNLDRDQYANPVPDIARKANILQFSLVGDGTYQGTIAPDENGIQGTFTAIDGSTTVPMNFTRVKDAKANLQGTSSPEGSLAGDWATTISFGGKQFRMVLHIRYNE